MRIYSYTVRWLCVCTFNFKGRLNSSGIFYTRSPQIIQRKHIHFIYRSRVSILKQTAYHYMYINGYTYCMFCLKAQYVPSFELISTNQSPYPESWVRKKTYNIWNDLEL